jgi:hypothetical protein
MPACSSDKVYAQMEEVYKPCQSMGQFKADPMKKAHHALAWARQADWGGYHHELPYSPG